MADKERVVKQISDLNDAELDEKIRSLERIAYSRNLNLAMQAREILASYAAERSNRLDKQFAEYTKESNMELNTIINIG